MLDDEENYVCMKWLFIGGDCEIIDEIDDGLENI